jgi:hypothetical protein
LKGGINAYISQRFQDVRFRAKPSDCVGNSAEIPLLSSEKSTFRGKNFVFDNRKAVAVTKDVVGACSHCASPASIHRNCAKKECFLLFLQCKACFELSNGFCSPECAGLQPSISASPPSREPEKPYYDQSVYLKHKSFFSRLQRVKPFNCETLRRFSTETRTFTSAEDYCNHFSSSLENGNLLNLMSVNTPSPVLCGPLQGKVQ